MAGGGHPNQSVIFTGSVVEGMDIKSLLIPNLGQPSKIRVIGKGTVAAFLNG